MWHTLHSRRHTLQNPITFFTCFRQIATVNFIDKEKNSNHRNLKSTLPSQILLLTYRVSYPTITAFLFKIVKRFKICYFQVALCIISFLSSSVIINCTDKTSSYGIPLKSLICSGV